MFLFSFIVEFIEEFYDTWGGLETIGKYLRNHGESLAGVRNIYNLHT